MGRNQKACETDCRVIISGENVPTSGGRDRPPDVGTFFDITTNHPAISHASTFFPIQPQPLSKFVPLYSRVSIYLVTLINE